MITKETLKRNRKDVKNHAKLENARIAAYSYKMGYRRGEFNAVVKGFGTNYEIVNDIFEYWLKTEQLKSLTFDGKKLVVELI